MVNQVDARSYRLTNIDMIRGLVLLIMAIDHVRDFFLLGTVQDPMSQPEISLSVYLTRWVTHFCAPVFVFLAGTSAGLMSSRKSSKAMSLFLLKRGLWLILIEVTVISTAFTFSPFDGVPQLGGQTLFGLQVIWAIGASMVILAGAQFLGTRACMFIGAVILLGHNSVDGIWPSGEFFSGTNPMWYGLHSTSSTVVGSVLLVFAYPLVPWAGVMLLGYGTAFIFEQSPDIRNRQLIKIGVAMLIGFIIIRLSGLYGDPNPWQVQELGVQATLFDFMNVSKYPPSLLFLLATLGPMTILCAYADRFKGRLKDILVMFGRVPFAFYIAHFYLIRLLSLLLAKYQGFAINDMMTFFFFFPKGYGVSLAWVYIVWLLVIIMLYPLCKWVADIKSRRKDWWLSYL